MARWAGNPERQMIDVAECLSRIDDLLLATPVRNGQARAIRLSLSPNSPPRASRASPRARQTGTDEGELDAAVLLFPVELLLKVLGQLPPDTLGCLRRVCRSWKLIVDTHQALLFKPLCIQRGWLKPNAAAGDLACCESSANAADGGGSDGNWMVVAASHWVAKQRWITGGYNKLNDSPWRDGKSAVMAFDAETWGEILEAN